MVSAFLPCEDRQLPSQRRVQTVADRVSLLAGWDGC